MTLCKVTPKSGFQAAAIMSAHVPHRLGLQQGPSRDGFCGPTTSETVLIVCHVGEDDPDPAHNAFLQRGTCSQPPPVAMGFLTTWRPLGSVEAFYRTKGTACPFLSQPCRPLAFPSAVLHWLHTSKSLGLEERACCGLNGTPEFTC